MIGKRIKELRKNKNLTQGAFCAPLKMDRSYLSQLESGSKNNPSDMLIEGIILHYGVNRLWLETGEGEMFLPAPPSPRIDPAEDTPDLNEVHNDYMKLPFEEKWFVKAIIDIFRSPDKEVANGIRPNIVLFTRLVGSPDLLARLREYEEKRKGQPSSHGPPLSKANGE